MIEDSQGSNSGVKNLIRSDLGVDLDWPRLERARTALVLIDMIKTEVDPSYAIGQYAARTGGDLSWYFTRCDEVVIPTIERMLAAFRANRLPVVHVRIRCDRDDASDWPIVHRRHALQRGVFPCRPGVDGYAWAEGCEPREGEPVMEKHSVSAFNSTGLGQVLHAMGVESILYCGVATNYGVGHTALDSSDLGFVPVVIADGCAAMTADSHENWLEMNSKLCVRVIDSDDALIELGIVEPGGPNR